METVGTRLGNRPVIASQPVLTHHSRQEDELFANSEELLRYVKDEGVKFVDVRFCDLPGIMQHFNVPVESFDDAVFTDGLAFDGSSIRGFQQIHESDMMLLPDVTTRLHRPVPRREDRRAQLLHPRPVHARGLLARPAQHRPQGRDLPRVQRRRRQRLLRRRGGVLHLRLDPPRDRRPTRRSTTSTRSRAPGTPAPKRSAATAATRPPTRAATSRSRRSTTTPTCATRWSAS